MKSRAKPINSFKCVFPAKSVNESFALTVVSSFVSQLDPRLGELSDLKTAVSEAVTNCIVHAYRDRTGELPVMLSAEYYSGGRVVVVIKDKGCGIEDVEKAMEPLFTTDAESERSGMGFTVMESFCDRVKVTSKPGKGTSVRLEKRISLT